MTGAKPVSANNDGADGKRLRFSPISEINTPAVTGPILGKLVKIAVSGCVSSSSLSRLLWARR